MVEISVGNEDRIERIKLVSEATKAIWFTYLAVSAYTVVTILGLSDLDAFSFSGSIELPIISATVDVSAFYISAALLVASIYIYLHVSLEKLWVELGEADAKSDGLELSRKIHPWIVADAALQIRAGLRRNDEKPIPSTALGAFGIFSSLVLCWVLGPIVLTLLWYYSMPIQLIWLTVTIGIVLVVASIVCALSFGSMLNHMRLSNPIPKSSKRKWKAALVLFLLILIILVSILRTEFDYLSGNSIPPDYSGFLSHPHHWFRPVPANLRNSNVTELREDWTSYDEARNSFFSVWCKRGDTPSCTTKLEPIWDTTSQFHSSEFKTRWTEQRDNEITRLRKPDLHGRSLRHGELGGAFLVGIDLRNSKLQHANFYGSKLEGANLSGSDLSHSDFRNADLIGARLGGADLTNASFTGATLVGVNLVSATLDDADLNLLDLRGSTLGHVKGKSANFRGSDLSFTHTFACWLPDSLFSQAKIDHANFSGCNLSGAELSGISGIEVSISDARLENVAVIAEIMSGLGDEGDTEFKPNLRGADFNRSFIANSQFHSANLNGASFAMATLKNVDFVNSDLTGVKFWSTLIEGSDGRKGVFDETVLSDADFTGAALRNINLSTSTGITEERLATSFGDGSITLPNDVNYPCMWSEEVLSDEEFHARWRGWLESKDPETYWPSLAPREFAEVVAIEPTIRCD